MTIRGKVLLFVAVALGLIGGMGAAVQHGTTQSRLLRHRVNGIHEKRYLLGQLRGNAMAFLNDLQRVHASGASTEVVLSQHRRRTEEQLSRLRELTEAEARWTGESRHEELVHLARTREALKVWADRAEARVRHLPSGLGSDGAHPRETISEFGWNVEPLLLAALEFEQEEIEEVERTAEHVLLAGELLSISVPLAALGGMLALALTILVTMNRRLRELLAGAERIGRGEFQHVLPERGRDEFGTLARRFNQMALELKDSQARLIAADRLASLGRTSASVGHEINNPLAYVLSNLSFLREELERARASPLSEKELGELVEAVAEAREGAERVRFIAQDLKSLSRAEDVSLGPVELGAVIRGMAKMASHELRGRARLVERCGEVPPVRGNETRLGQVFLNLIINAAQAIAPGDEAHNEIRVMARVSAPGYVTVDVQDTGSGIPPENLERIFDPFFTTKANGEGTGLGLLVCRTIVTSLGGTLSVESQQGQGTTFHVTLPIASAD